MKFRKTFSVFFSLERGICFAIIKFSVYFAISRQREKFSLIISDIVFTYCYISEKFVTLENP